MIGKPENDNGLLEYFKADKVRQTANEFLDLAVNGKLAHVEVDLEKLDQALVKVLETAKQTYPDMQIPPYGVWRLFEAGNSDRWAALASARNFETADSLLASAADLGLLATYMNVVPPAGWTFQDPMTGEAFKGKEGLAVAVLNMFAAGSFSSDPSDPFRVDADALIRLDPKELASGLQWDPTADEARLQKLQRHLKRLGEALALRPDFFADGEDTRPGHFAVKLGNAGWGSIDAAQALDQLQQSLAPLWEGGASEGDVSFGDAFYYPIGSGEADKRIVPLHLNVQQMIYGLVEPLAWAGYEVDELDVLTGLPDIEHAALFAGAGVLNISDEPELSEEQAQDRMVELRAVTVALTERLADILRKELSADEGQLPLSCVLEGGTSRAGAEFLRKNTDLAEKLSRFLNPGSVFWLPFGA